MPDAAVEFATKMIEFLFKGKNRPHISVLIYVFSCAIGVLSATSLITPFHCNADFLDVINWEQNLSDDSTVIQLASGTTLAYIVYCVIRKLFLYFYRMESDARFIQIYTILYTIDDILDLIAAASSFLFIVSVFLQIYNTGILFTSNSATVVYTWIAIRASVFVIRKIAHRNEKLVRDALK